MIEKPGYFIIHLAEHRKERLAIGVSQAEEWMRLGGWSKDGTAFFFNIQRPKNIQQHRELRDFDAGIDLEKYDLASGRIESLRGLTRS